MKRSNWSSRSALLTTVGILLFTVLIGCVQPSAPAPPAPSEKPRAAVENDAKPEGKQSKPESVARGPERRIVKLTVPFNAIAGTHLPLWVTKEKGLFEKYGLDVEIPYIASSTTLVQAMVSGEIQLAQTAGGAAVSANLAGANLVIVAATNNVLTFSLYGLPSVSRIDDLKGKAVGVSRFGSSTDFAARYALKRFGLEPEKDVTIVQTGGSPESLAALQAGGIHAAVFGPPTTLQAKKAGYHEVVSIADLGIPYAQTLIVANRQFLATDQETVVGFLRAMLEGIAVAKHDKDFTLKVVGKYAKTEEREVLEETYDIFVTRHLPKVPYASAEALQTVLEEVARENPKARDVKPEVFIENRLLKQLDDSGFVKKLYGEQ